VTLRCLSLAALAASLNLLCGQPAATFEAASIKPANGAARGGGLQLDSGRLRIVNSSLKFCVEVAWNLKDFQVAGATGWMDSEHFDIDAVAGRPFAKGEYRTMLQALLADRFGLATHRQVLDRPGYALVAAKNGPKLPPPQDSPDILFSRTPAGDVTLKATSASMKQLADALATATGSLVVDQTGIEGKYDVSLEYAPDPANQPKFNKRGEPLPEPPADATPGPSIFAALQERLGLKLEARKLPVEVIVIDQARRPSEN